MNRRSNAAYYIIVFGFCGIILFLSFWEVESSPRANSNRKGSVIAADTSWALSPSALTDSVKTDRIDYSINEYYSYSTYEQSSSNSLPDLWNDAENIRQQATEILSLADSRGCIEAAGAAESAISYSDYCSASSDYGEAESYLYEAQSQLSSAESYLDDCQDHRQGDEDESEDE